MMSQVQRKHVRGPNLADTATAGKTFDTLSAMLWPFFRHMFDPSIPCCFQHIGTVGKVIRSACAKGTHTPWARATSLEAMTCHDMT